MLVTVTEAKARLGELIREAAEEDVVVVRHGHPVAVLVGADHYDAVLEEMEDLKDRLSVYESALYEAGPGVKGMIVGARAADGAGVKVERPQQGEDERP